MVETSLLLHFSTSSPLFISLSFFLFTESRLAHVPLRFSGWVNVFPDLDTRFFTDFASRLFSVKTTDRIPL